jgi:hypothetical protein
MSCWPSASSSDTLKLVAFVCLAVVYTKCVFRALAQPITVDEAYVFFKYISHRPFFAIFDTRYDSANHVLQTALSYVTVHLLGTSEIAMRLPTLLSAPFYLIAAWRLAFMSFRRLIFAVLALGLIVLNPVVLDYLCLGRGYGIALTLFAWSLYFSLRYFNDRNPGALISAGVLLGLSTAANLTFVIPGIGLGLMMISGICFPLAIRYCGSAVASGAALLARPLVSARPADFYFGAPDVVRSVTNLSNASMFYHGRMPLFFEWTGSYLALIRFVDFTVAPLVLAAIVLLWVARFRTAHLLRLTGGSLLISIVLLVAVHELVGLKYPYDRTGIYLMFLFPLALVAALCTLFESRSAMRWTEAPAIAVLAAVLVIYCLEFPTGDFAEWAFAADVKPYMEQMRQRSPTGKLRIGGSFVFSYLVNFYREEHRSNRLLSFEPPSLAPGYDYYLLLPEDRQYVDQLGLRVLSQTRESILAAP